MFRSLDRLRFALPVVLILLVAGCSEEGEPVGSTGIRSAADPAPIEVVSPPPASISPRSAPSSALQEEEPGYEVPPGFHPWVDPFLVQGPIDGTVRDRVLLDEAWALLDLPVESLESLVHLARLVEVLGPADPTRCEEALGEAFQSASDLSDPQRWEAWAHLATAAIALLPRTGGALIQRLLEARQADAHSVASGDLPLALLGALEPARAGLQERLKLIAYLFGPVGRLRDRGQRRELLIGIASGCASVGGEMGIELLGHVLQRGPLAIDASEMVPVRLAVAAALARLSSEEEIESEFLSRLIAETSHLDAAEDRYRYLDSLTMATIGLEGEPAISALGQIAAEGAKMPEEGSWRRWTLVSVAFEEARRGAAGDPAWFEGARDRLLALELEPSVRIRNLGLLCAIVGPGHSERVASWLDELFEEAVARLDPPARGRVLVPLLETASHLPAPRARAIVDRLLEVLREKEEATIDPEVLAALAGLAGPDEAPELRRRALEGAEAHDDPDDAVDVLVRLARDDESDEALSAALIGFIGRRVGPESAAADWESLSRLCERACDLPPLVAEAGIVHLLEAVSAGEDGAHRLALILWGIDSLVAIGSPRSSAWLSVAAESFEDRIPASGAWSNLARLATMVGGEAGPRVVEILGKRIEVFLSSDPEEGLEIALAVTAGYLAGDPGKRIDEIGAVFRRLDSLPDRGRAIAAAMGRLAARLDGDRLCRLASRIESRGARFAFFLAVAPGLDRP